MRQASCPDRTRNLPNGDLDLSHVHLATRPSADLIGRGSLEEQRQRLSEVLACLGNRFGLAGHIDFRAQGHVAVPIAFDNRRQEPVHALPLAGACLGTEYVRKQPSAATNFDC